MLVCLKQQALMRTKKSTCLEKISSIRLFLMIMEYNSVVHVQFQIGYSKFFMCLIHKKLFPPKPVGGTASMSQYLFAETIMERKTGREKKKKGRQYLKTKTKLKNHYCKISLHVHTCITI